MGFIKPVGPPDTSSDLVVSAPEHLRQTAARILAEVSVATQQHETTWRQAQDWLNKEIDPVWADIMRTCLDSSVQRLRASYDWLTDLASALFQAADTLEQADQQIADSFEPSSSPQSPTDSTAGSLPTHGFVP